MIQRSITVSVSYLEIYNESVNDLLDAGKRNLDVRDHWGEVIVEGYKFEESVPTCHNDVAWR